AFFISSGSFFAYFQGPASSFDCNHQSCTRRKYNFLFSSNRIMDRVLITRCSLVLGTSRIWGAQSIRTCNGGLVAMVILGGSFLTSTLLTTSSSVSSSASRRSSEIVFVTVGNLFS